MARQREALPYVCFAPEGESHSNCLNEPFQNDATFYDDGVSRIWIGYRQDMDKSYDGGMTLRQVLAQAAANLARASRATSGESRSKWLEAFPGLSIKASEDITQNLERDGRAFKQAFCQSAECKRTTGREPLQMEWISVQNTAPGSSRPETGYLIGYIFNLNGHEMISICRNYYFSLYRFQRVDGSVSPDMFLSTRHSKSDSSEGSLEDETNMGDEDNEPTHRIPGSRHSDNSKARNQDSFQHDETSPTDPDPNDNSAGRVTAPESPQFHPSEDAMQLDEADATSRSRVGANVNEQQQVLRSMRQLQTNEEYNAMVVQLTHTYSCKVFALPALGPQIKRLEQAVRDDDRITLCRAFARILTYLLTNACTAPETLDEEYERMIANATTDYGTDALSYAGAAVFIHGMGNAMVAGDREGLCRSYAGLKEYMVAHGA